MIWGGPILCQTYQTQYNMICMYCIAGMSLYSIQQQREKRVTCCVFIVDVIGKT